MSQYQPPQGGPNPQPSPFPQQQQPPQGFGQQSQAPQGFGPPAQAPQGFGQQSQAQFGQPGFGQQPGYPQQNFQQTPAEPGLFDTSFAKPTTLKVAKTAYISVIVLAGTLVLFGLFSAISSFSTAASLAEIPGGGGGAGYVLAGIGQLLFLPALGFAILTLGRLFIEYAVEAHKARAAAAASSEKA